MPSYDLMFHPSGLYILMAPFRVSMNQDFPQPITPTGSSKEATLRARVEVSTAAKSDEILLDGIRANDPQAMSDLFDRYGALVYSVAFRVLRDASQAEDVMQEIFFQTWKAPRNWTGGQGSFAAWLSVVARNRAIDILRRRKFSDSVEDVILISPGNLASETERNALIERIRIELKTLPSEQQQSLEMAFFEGLTHAEIAMRTGDPLGTVKTRIRLALMRLRKALQG